MRFFILFLFFVFSINALAQARRIPPRTTSPSPTNAENNGNTAATAAAPPVVIEGQTAAQMYDDAKTYAKRKFDEFASKKVPYSEQLRERTQLEAKQLAARYAAQIQAKNITGEDFYYLGSLHILAENSDGANEAFQKFLALKELNQEKAQTARAFVVVTAARNKDFVAAETALGEYLKNAPIILRERVLVENELAKQYFAAKNYSAAAVHAAAAVAAGQAAIKNSSVEPRLFEIFAEAGFTLFDVSAETKANEKAAAALETLRATSIATQSAGLYARATGKLISFLIETNRKPEAMQIFKTSLDSISTNFRDPMLRQNIAVFLRSREKQYKLLGEPAPEITIAKWIDEKGGEASGVSIANLRGRVVLLDFWATHCKPCFAQFPDLIEWHETYSRQGLSIIGLTRYYGFANGLSADETNEFAFLQRFKRTERLPYGFAIAKDNENHNNYGVYAIPIMILIDKKGVIRYSEPGVRNEKEIETMIQKLLAEN